MLFVIGDLSAGGSQRVLQRLSDTLVARGLAVAVVTFSLPGSDFFRLHPDIRRIALGTQAPSPGALTSVWRNLRVLWRLHRVIAGERPATVCSFLSVTNLLTIVASAGSPARLVVCERNHPTRQRLGFPWRPLRRILYRWASVVTANSASALQELARYVPGQKLKLVVNPPPPVSQDGRPRNLVVLAIGRLTRQKGFDILLAAWAAVPAPGWHLQIVGEGPDRAALEAQAKGPALAGRVRFLPPTPDVASLYETAGILAAPSRFEGTPNVVLEAIAAGLPVIVSTACGDALDIVEDGRSGLVVPVEDVGALQKALEDLVQHAERRTAFAAAAATGLATALAGSLDSWLDALALPPQRGA